MKPLDPDPPSTPTPALAGAVSRLKDAIAALEAELADLTLEEAVAFREGAPSALDEVVQRLRDVLDLITFFTAGEKETRAWPLRNGQTALDAAGEIHSDMQRGFIRAETIAYGDYVTFAGETGAREAGKLRQEGKEYVVKDGDVLHFKFNV